MKITQINTTEAKTSLFERNNYALTSDNIAHNFTIKPLRSLSPEEFDTLSQSVNTCFVHINWKEDMA